MRRNVMDPRATRGRTAGVLAITFALVGCGGGATASTADQPGPSVGAAGSLAASAAPGEASVPAGTDAPAPSADTASGDLNTAVVIIGDDKYEFSGVRCDIFGPRYIQAGNYGEDPEVIIVLPPEGWESQGDTYSPPAVSVTVGSGADEMVWAAGKASAVDFMPGLEGLSQIDSYTVPDGRPVHATGTATFIDATAVSLGRDAKPVTGSFEVTCP